MCDALCLRWVCVSGERDDSLARGEPPNTHAEDRKRRFEDNSAVCVLEAVRSEVGDGELAHHYHHIKRQSKPHARGSTWASSRLPQSCGAATSEELPVLSVSN